jgi:peptidoglycan/xylan/chitin deacetylase (PgdA/CDA1 family)
MWTAAGDVEGGASAAYPTFPWDGVTRAEGGVVAELHRRELLTLLALGTVSALTGCTAAGTQTLGGPAPGPLPQPAPAPGLAAAGPVPPPASPAATQEATGLTTEEPTLAASASAAPVLIRELPPEAKLADLIAITIDDGYDRETVSAYVAFAQATGIHLTFNPNGTYGHVWDQHAPVLMPLIEAGQVQIGNHTFSHKDVKRLSEHGMEEELEKNEQWVQDTFATTTRPWFRPPYGFRDERTDGIAAGLGWTNILLWNGSFGDSGLLRPRVLLEQADKYLRAGTIMLGHANHPTVTHLYPEIVALLTTRGLTPKTLTEAFSLPA